MTLSSSQAPSGQRAIPRSAAAFLTFVFVLIGAQIYHLIGNVAAAIVQKVADDTGVVFVIWLALALGGPVIGYTGAYRALRTGILKDSLLKVFFVMFCITIRSGNWHPSPWVLSIGFQLDWEFVTIGINGIGIVLLTIYSVLPDPERALIESPEKAAAL